MEKIQLKSATRKELRPAEKLRKSGQIPGVLYGHGISNLHLALSQNEFEKVLRKAGESTIIELLTEDGEAHNVLIHDVQTHYLTSRPIHVDFYEVKMTERLTATVPLEFSGESDAVKLQGGTLVKVINEVEVECLPADLPHQIDVDISVLKTFQDTIHIKDLKVSDKLEIKAEADEVVAMVQQPRDVEAELAKEIGDVSEVEGIKEEAPIEGAEGEAAVEAEGKPAKAEASSKKE